LTILAERPQYFDLALVDAVMPGLGGIELIRRMREYAPKLRCLVMSGYANTSNQATADTWLTKPFSPEEILLAVRRSLDE
jgi:CheY-like chemotaxis protein